MSDDFNYERDHWDKLGGGDLDGAEWVPTSELRRFREYARRPGEQQGADPQYYDRLKNHIAQKGMQSPLWLEFDANDHVGYLGEGNHRLSIAEDLGMSHVPVKVNRRHKSYSKVRTPMDLQTHLLDTDHTGKPYIPQYMKPSQVGLPGLPSNPADARRLAYDFDEDWEEDLDSFLRSQDEVRPWGRGGHGKFIITPDGQFVSWATNPAGEPHHDVVADERGVKQIVKGDIAPSGAWWVTDPVDPTADPEEWVEKVAPQAAQAGLRPPVRNYVAKKLDICSVCLHPYEECTCDPGGWVDDPVADPFRDLKGPVQSAWTQERRRPATMGGPSDASPLPD